MSTPHGCNDDSDVVEKFKEALKQRVGGERFQIWFSGVRFRFDEASEAIVAFAHGQFAADRLAKHYLSAMRGAAAATSGKTIAVRIEVDVQPAQPVDLPFVSEEKNSRSDSITVSTGAKEESHSSANIAPAQRTGRSNSDSANRRGKRSSAQSLNAILRDGKDSRRPSKGMRSSPPRTQSQESATPLFAGTDPKPSENAWESFVPGRCNELARTACKMAVEAPGMASPLVLWGPPGAGKTHLLNAVASKLRGVHRMRRVVYMAAEEFTNDFIKSLNGNSLPAFRSRFRDADALLIDDIQFFVEKKATIRELHHTIEMLAESGKPLVFAGTKSPTEINGLGGELSGRLASGLVCQVETLDEETKFHLLKRYAEERCAFPCDEDVMREIASLADGDGRMLSGIVNLISLLQRMYSKMPTMDQIRQHGGHLLRRSGVPITLSAIERAVEKVFQLDAKSLQSDSQTKSITEPRMLAMYLSREMTSSAYSEIGGHFGGRSHSTAILANQRVRQWLEGGRSVGRGKAALSTDEAIRRVETMLKTG